MNEIDKKIREQINVAYNNGDAQALDQFYHLLNEIIADLTFKRMLLGRPEEASEPEERLEMVDQDRLGKAFD